MPNQNDEKFRYEEAYRAWISALRETFPQGADVRHAVFAKAKELESDLSRIPEIKTSVVANWFGRPNGQYGSLPADNDVLLSALDAVISRRVPKPPDTDLPDVDFLTVVKKLRRLRQRNSRADQRFADRVKRAEAIILPFMRAREIDPKKLGLGSWAFTGDVPAYSSRNSDLELLDALNDPSRRLVTIVGPPKSGKTRSLVQSIQQSKLASYEVLWLRPSTSALERVLSELGPVEAREVVIVIDDLQRYAGNVEDWLTIGRLRQLESIGKVLITLHDSTYSRWARQLEDHTKSDGMGLDREVVEEMSGGTIYYSSKLSESERNQVATTIHFREGLEPDIAHLPGWLASVETLSRMAEDLRQSSVAGAALMAGIIDARILFTSGAKLQTIEKLTEVNFRRLNPNGIWQTHQDDYAVALKATTTGVVAGSPHAILTRVPGESELFVLLDALWKRLSPAEPWEANHLGEIGMSDLAIGNSAYQAGLTSSAKSIFLKGAMAEDTECMVRLGQALQSDADLDDAEYWYRKALDLDAGVKAEKHIRAAMNNLGQILMDSGHIDAARELLERAIDESSGEDAVPLDNLGLLHWRQGNVDLARSYLLRASKRKFAPAMNRLGAIYMEQGQTDVAARWFHVSASFAEPDFGSAEENLGRLFFKEGQTDLALKHLKKAAATGTARSKTIYGWALLETGDSDTASRILEDAVTAGDELANVYMTRVLIKRGELDQAELLLKSCLESENDDVDRLELLKMFSELYFRKGDLDVAKQWLLEWLSASGGQDALALSNLALVALQNKEVDEALLYAKRALEIDPATNAHLTLAWIYEDLGEHENARRQFESILESHPESSEFHKKALHEFGNYLFRRGEFAKSDEILRSAIDLGLPLAFDHYIGSLESQKRFSEAEAFLRAKIARNEKQNVDRDPSLYHELGRMCQYQTNWVLAAEAYEIALSLSPDTSNGPLLYNFAETRSALGDDQAALDLFEKASNLGLVEAWGGIGTIHKKTGAFLDAERALVEGYSRGDISAGQELAALYLEMGDMPRALALFEECASLGDGMAQVSAAVLLQEQGETERARIWWIKAIDQGEASSAGFAYTTNGFGLWHENFGDPGEAERLYRSAAEMGFAPAMNNLAKMLYVNGDVSDAEEWARRSIAQGYHLGWSVLGWLLCEQGKTEDGITAMKRAYHEAPESLGYLDIQNVNRLGWAYLNEANLDEAEDWFAIGAELEDRTSIENLGEVEYRRERRAWARKWYDKAARMGSVGAMFRLGQIAHEAKQFALATSWYEKIRQASPGTLVWSYSAIGMSDVMEKDADTESAISILRDGVERFPQSALIFALASILRRTQTDQTESAALYLRAAEEPSAVVWDPKLMEKDWARILQFDDFDKNWLGTQP